MHHYSKTTGTVGISAGINRIKNTVDTVGTGNHYDNDSLYEDYADLVNPKFKRWYMKAFFEIGKQQTMKLASIARADGKDPKRYFNYLLKQQLGGGHEEVHY